ncbi:hypothetical protein [Paraburkholderia domus]|uniref:hypothetical protein n=1 Tax=Paraburkholderia domus TaxID=2793075 RepID=UPI0019120A9E|nr:hypothetical protein [Paraburkholderia domus]MBK5064845.1 hypothetical protein [Burkholderia sp. R-70199]CAE6967543.1 hypothetical protein R70199_07858 [Paraburkholderia domus]
MTAEKIGRLITTLRASGGKNTIHPHSGTWMLDAADASSAIDAILAGGDLVANAYDYFREDSSRHANSVDFRIGWDACLDAIGNARAALPASSGDAKDGTAAQTASATGAPTLRRQPENRPALSVVASYATATAAKVQTDETRVSNPEDAYVIKRLSTVLAEVYIALTGNTALSVDGSTAFKQVVEAAVVLRLEVDLYRAQADLSKRNGAVKP